MKHFLFLPAFLLLSLVCASQSPSHAFGAMPYSVGIDFLSTLRHDVGGALLFKMKTGQTYHKKWRRQTAARLLSTAYFDKETNGSRSFSGNNSYPSHYYGTSRTHVINIAVGFEKQWTWKRLQFFAGSDIIYEHANEKGKDWWIYEYDTGGFFSDIVSSSDVNNRLGFSLFAGLECFVTRRLSLRSEVFIPVMLSQRYYLTMSSTRRRLYVEYPLSVPFQAPRLAVLNFYF